MIHFQSLFTSLYILGKHYKFDCLWSNEEVEVTELAEAILLPKMLGLGISIEGFLFFEEDSL